MRALKFITGNVILNLHYNQIYQLKTTISFVQNFCFCFLESDLGSFSTIHLSTELQYDGQHCPRLPVLLDKIVYISVL